MGRRDTAPPGSSGGRPEARRLVILIGSLCTAAVIAIVAIASEGEIDETGAKAL
jgi:hypothetical protein